MGIVWGVKLGVLKDSESIETMYLSLKSLIGGIMITPSLIFVLKLGLLQFLYTILFSDYTCLYTLNTIPLTAGGYKTGM